MTSKALLSTAIALFLSATTTTIQASTLPETKQNSVGAPRNPDEGLAFVFELVRHGARSPIEDRNIDMFPVGEGLLTPEGMRERYLLGRHNRQRYVETYNLISVDLNPSEIYMQSTNVNRTLQSGYSELMGLYPPGSGEKLTADQSKAVGSFSAPPFQVRDADTINSELNDAALPDYYVQISLTEFNNHDIHDDASTDGCAFINTVGHEREFEKTVWDPYNWMIVQSEEPVEAALDVTQEYVDNLDTWHDYQMMTDTIIAMDFEGYPEHEEYFSDDQWEVINQTQHVWLIDDYTPDATALMMSRMLRKPVSIMKKKVADMLGKEIEDSEQLVSDQEATDLKFFIYSAHDTQVVNMMGFLQKDFDWVPFASQVTFELKYSAKCLASESADETCFGVSVAFNGTPQLFEGCTGDNFTLEGCKFPEFLAYLDSVWYSGPGTPDLDKACSEPI